MARGEHHNRRQSRCKVALKPTRVQPPRRAKLSNEQVREETPALKGTTVATTESTAPSKPSHVKARQSQRSKEIKMAAPEVAKISSKDPRSRPRRTTSQRPQPGTKKTSSRSTTSYAIPPQTSALTAMKPDPSKRTPHPFIFNDPLNDPPPPLPEGHKLVHLVRHCRAWHKYNFLSRL
jgi:hypothetical protein